MNWTHQDSEDFINFYTFSWKLQAYVLCPLGPGGLIALRTPNIGVYFDFWFSCLGLHCWGCPSRVRYANCAQWHKEERRNTRGHYWCPLPLSNIHCLLLAFIFYNVSYSGTGGSSECFYYNCRFCDPCSHPEQV